MSNSNMKLSGTESHLNDRFSAAIYVKRSEEINVLQKLHEMEMALLKMGIHLSVGPNRKQGIKNFIACTLSVTIDRDITSRGAGRRSKDSGFSLADIEAFSSHGNSPQEIAANIGMSRATYYRHLAKARELHDQGKDANDISF